MSAAPPFVESPGETNRTSALVQALVAGKEQKITEVISMGCVADESHIWEFYADIWKGEVAKVSEYLENNPKEDPRCYPWALNLAAWQSSPAILKMLVSDLRTKEDKEGQRKIWEKAFLMAVEQENGSLEELLKAIGPVKKLEGLIGELPLAIVCQKEDKKKTEALLSHGADPNTTTHAGQGKGTIPLLALALLNADTGIADALVKHGAKKELPEKILEDGFWPGGSPALAAVDWMIRNRARTPKNPEPWQELNVAKTLSRLVFQVDIEKGDLEKSLKVMADWPLKLLKKLKSKWSTPIFEKDQELAEILQKTIVKKKQAEIEKTRKEFGMTI
jgi:hypothetical protein